MNFTTETQGHGEFPFDPELPTDLCVSVSLW